MDPTAEEAPRSPGLRVGEAIGTSFSIWSRNLPRLAAISFLIQLPVLITAYFLLSPLQGLGHWEAFWSHFDLMAWEFLISFLVFWKLVTGAVTHAVVTSLRGRTPSILHCMETAARRFIPLVIAAVVASAITILPKFLLGLSRRPSTGLFLLLLVPAAFVYVIFYVVEPVVIAERPRALGLAALPRSIMLTRGSRLAIFGLLLFLGLCFFGLAMLYGFVSRNALGRYDYVGFYYLRQGFSIVFMPILSVASAVVYHRLRLVRDGVDVAEVIHVFE